MLELIGKELLNSSVSILFNLNGAKGKKSMDQEMPVLLTVVVYMVRLSPFLHLITLKESTELN